MIEFDSYQKFPSLKPLRGQVTYNFEDKEKGLADSESMASRTGPDEEPIHFEIRNDDEEFSPCYSQATPFEFNYALNMIDRTFSPASSIMTPEATSSWMRGVRDFNPADFVYEVHYDTFEQMTNQSKDYLQSQ